MPTRATALQLWAKLGFRDTAPYRDYPFEMRYLELRCGDEQGTLP